MNTQLTRFDLITIPVSAAPSLIETLFAKMTFLVICDSLRIFYFTNFDGLYCTTFVINSNY
ncbi:hypothetical protein M1N65_03615, partial [Thermodesulfovibrionales bacterium]|nr:hypothetical protein [Thermodesulfovibrionales bacterium]